MGEPYAAHLCGSTMGRLQTVRLWKGTGAVGYRGVSGNQASAHQSERTAHRMVLRWQPFNYVLPFPAPSRKHWPTAACEPYHAVLRMPHLCMWRRLKMQSWRMWTGTAT